MRLNETANGSKFLDLRMALSALTLLRVHQVIGAGAKHGVDLVVGVAQTFAKHELGTV